MMIYDDDDDGDDEDDEDVVVVVGVVDDVRMKHQRDTMPYTLLRTLTMDLYCATLHIETLYEIPRRC